MSLTNVLMSEEVWLTCMTHSLTTEKEEIMGLLFGDIEHSSTGRVTAVIWGAAPQMRSERKKDRVETNPELLAAASAQAERMSVAAGKRTRVIGWYHSHPHITVLPSHVDVRTQAMYQLMEPGFIGLIFSCFSEDADKTGRIQVIAFQSLDREQRFAPVAALNSVIELESSRSSSESTFSATRSALNQNFELDTADSRASGAINVVGRPSEKNLASQLNSNDSGKHQTRENSLAIYHPDIMREEDIANLDSPDMTPSMQEALHRSNVDMSGAEYIRKEVPIHVLPAKAIVKLDDPLSSLSDLQYVLLHEEKSAYNHAVNQNPSNDGKMHPLCFIHHTMTYHATLCKLLEYCLSPALTALQHRVKENEIRLTKAKEEEKMLQSVITGGSEKVARSPRHSQQRIPGNPEANQGSSRSPGSSIGSRRKAY